MAPTSAHSLQLILVALLLAVVAFGTLARKLRLPYPLVLFGAGLLVSVVPGLPRVTLDPDVVFFVVLPPLLYAGAWTTPWREFSYNIVSIALLAFGLVAFTVAGVALAAPFILPGFDGRTGFVLGAVISPTDAIAATTIARNMGLPRRVVDVLEGESLVNDATGLLAVELGVLLLAWGAAPPLAFSAFRLGYLVAVGIAVGLSLGVVTYLVERRIDDGPVEMVISILVPYGAYLIADAVHASGVLAVVAAGLYLSRKSPRFFTPTVRLQAYAVWNALTFAVNGLVFVLMGLQLPLALAGIGRLGLGRMVAAAAALGALVIVLRIAWVFSGERLAYAIRRRLLRQREDAPAPGELFIMGWSGMRGVIALAAAMALPHALPGGEAFPQRHAIVFLTFSVILVTLGIQGMTMPALIRLLRLGRPPGPSCEEQEARRIVLESALARLRSLREGDGEGLAPLYDDLEEHYRRRLSSVAAAGGSSDEAAASAGRRAGEISGELLRVQRETAIRLRDDRRINDEVLREIERELDLQEARLQAARRRSA